MRCSSRSAPSRTHHLRLAHRQQLPIGDQKIYRSRTRRRKTTTVVTGHNVTEDNGFISSLDVPLDRHTTLSAYYSRSLRQKDDVASIGVAYVFRGAKSSEGADDVAPHTFTSADQRDFDALKLTDSTERATRRPPSLDCHM